MSLRERTRPGLGIIEPCLPSSAERRNRFQHACKLGCEGIVSKRLGSMYRSGRSPHWVKVKNPNAPAVKREEEEDWR